MIRWRSKGLPHRLNICNVRKYPRGNFASVRFELKDHRSRELNDCRPAHHERIDLLDAAWLSFTKNPVLGMACRVQIL